MQVVKYFSRHWRGELGLGVSFWTSGVMGYLFLVGIAVCLPESTGIGSLRISAAVGMLFSMFCLLALLWQTVGIWRSASKHTNRGGQQIWARLAKLAVALVVLARAVTIKTDTIPLTIERWTILTGDKQIPPYEIRVLAGGKEIEFNGGIRCGAAAALEETLKALPEAKVLHVNSTGGRGREAESMARSVRERSLITYTSEQCLSAATLVLIAGKERVVDAKAIVGFHGGLRGTATQKRSDNTSFRGAMLAAGISDEFINRALATPNDDMWFPSIEEMLRARVVTSQSFGDRFAVSGFRLRRSSPHDLDEDYGNRPWFRAVKEVEPAAYQQMLHAVYLAVQSGKTRAETENVFRLVSDKLWAKYSVKVSDDTLLIMRDLWIAMLETVIDKDRQPGGGIFSPESPSPNVDHGLLYCKETRSNNLVLVETVLRGAVKGPVPQVDAGIAGKDLAAIRSKLMQNYGADADLISKPDEWMRNPQRTRVVLLAFYRETQKIPTDRQCNLLRSFWFKGN